MKIHKKFFSQVLHWNTAFPIRRPGSQMSTANFDYPHQTKRRLLTSASPLISAAPYMWRLLEIVHIPILLTPIQKWILNKYTSVEHCKNCLYLPSRQLLVQSQQ